MKKLFTLLVVASIIALASCGNGNQEAIEKAKLDSIAKADSITKAAEQAKLDTTVKVDTTVKTK